MTRSRVRAIFDTYADTHQAVNALVQQSFSPRRISVRAEVDDTWKAVPFRFQRLDNEGAMLGALAGLLVVATAMAAHAAGFMALGHGDPVFTTGWLTPVLSFALGGFLGGLAGVLWGLGHSELTVDRPSASGEGRYAIEVYGPKSLDAREILMNQGAVRIA